jgi:hypothetical protein
VCSSDLTAQAAENFLVDLGYTIEFP